MKWGWADAHSNKYNGFPHQNKTLLTNIMEILKNSKLKKYHNNIQQLFRSVTGVAPPTLTRKEEQKDKRDVSRSRDVIQKIYK